MSVYTDGVHLCADTLTELHAFALGIGLKRVWFQNNNPYSPHYDLTTPRAVHKALRAGAIKVAPRELVRVVRAARGTQEPIACDKQSTSNSASNDTLEVKP